MKVKGINNAYGVEIKRMGSGIAIIVGDITARSMGALISEKEWNRIVKKIKCGKN